MANLLYDQILGKWASSSAPFLFSAPNQYVSYQQFCDLVSKIANAFLEYGVKPGDRVTAQVSKSQESFALYFAAVGVGAVYSPLNTDYTATELSYFVKDAKPSLVICDPSAVDKIQEVSSSVGAALATLSSDGSGSLAELVSMQTNSFYPASRSKDDLAAILYTSGTTGRPKGAMLTHGNLLSNALSLVDVWRFTEADVLLHALPIFHAHGLFVATNTVALAGASMIFQPRFFVDDVIRSLPDATVMMGVPTFYTRLLSDNRLDRKLVSHMRLFISGSAPLLAETHSMFENRTGHQILERYGMTETTMITSNPYERLRKAGTVGFPLPGVSIRIRGTETSSEASIGETGVLEVSGPNVFRGYWEKPEATAADFQSDGYFVTGDLARIDEEGYITIVGRNKDLIISGGYNIYPREIEELIDGVYGVSESAIVGVPHPDFGEAVVAVIVPTGQETISTDFILDAISPKIAKYKKPKHIVIVQRLPRNAMGKIQKNILRDEFKGLYAQEARCTI